MENSNSLKNQDNNNNINQSDKNINNNVNNNNISHNEENNQIYNNNTNGGKWKIYLRKVVPYILVGIIFFSLGFGLDRMIMRKKNRKLLRERPGVNEKINKYQNLTPKAGKKKI